MFNLGCEINLFEAFKQMLGQKCINRISTPSSFVLNTLEKHAGKPTQSDKKSIISKCSVLLDTQHFSRIISFLYRIKSVVRKLDLSSLMIFLIILLFASMSFAANNVLIEKTLNASETDKVPSAESFLPVNGKVSGPR